MDLDERAVRIVGEAEILSGTDLRAALAKMREALAIEPDYPNLEDEIFIREDAITKLDGLLEFIVVLLREGKDYQGCEMLESLPDNYIIRDKSGLVGGLVEKITRVEGLVEKARGLPKSGCVEALALLEESYQLVSDYPGLAEDVATYTKEVKQYNSYLGAIEQALKSRNAENATDLLAKFREAYPDDENVSRLKVSIVNLGKELLDKKTKKVNFLKVVIAVGLVLVIGGAYFGYEMVMIGKAARQWEKANSLLVAQKFTETQTACREINQNLGRVRFFFLTRKQELQGKVDDVLQSDLVVKGAEGKVLFDGDYIPKEHLASSMGVKKSIGEAQALVEAGNYLEAIKKFEEALATTTGMDAQTSKRINDDIKLSITRCRLNMIRDLVAKAGALMTTGSYNAAQSLITEAVTMVKENALDVNEPVVVKALVVDKEIRLAKLRDLIALGDKLFVANLYDDAIKSYRAAQAFARENEIASALISQRIDGMIDKSKFKELVRRGDRYLASAKWQEAARAYESGIALALQADLQNLPSFQGAQTNLRKAKKMHVAVSLAQQDKLARQHLKANKHTEAKRVFLQAIETGEASPWHDAMEVVVVLGKLKSGLAEVEEAIFVNAKKKFLNDRYVSILKKDFGLSGDVALLNPEIVLLSATPKLLKFMVSAISYSKTGTKGKYSRYEAIYVFDRGRKVWGLIDKSSDSKVTADREYN